MVDGRRKSEGARRKISDISLKHMIEDTWSNDRFILIFFFFSNIYIHIYDNNIGSKMEAFPSEIFSSDPFMAGIGFMKEKIHIDILKEPSSDAIAIEKTIDSIFYSAT